MEPNIDITDKQMSVKFQKIFYVLFNNDREKKELPSIKVLMVNLNLDLELYQFTLHLIQKYIEVKTSK